jgi:hypothetical protein
MEHRNSLGSTASDSPGYVRGSSLPLDADGPFGASCIVLSMTLVVENSGPAPSLSCRTVGAPLCSSPRRLFEEHGQAATGLDGRGQRAHPITEAGQIFLSRMITGALRRRRRRRRRRMHGRGRASTAVHLTCTALARPRSHPRRARFMRPSSHWPPTTAPPLHHSTTCESSTRTTAFSSRLCSSRSWCLTDLPRRLLQPCCSQSRAAGLPSSAPHATDGLIGCFALLFRNDGCK